MAGYLMHGLVVKVLAATLIGVAVQAQEAPQHSSATKAGQGIDLAFDAKSGLLSGQVLSGTSRAAIIERIGEVAGIDVKLSARLGKLGRAIEFDGLTVGAALNRIISANSVVLFYDDSATPPEIRKIWVVAEADGDVPTAEMAEGTPQAAATSPPVQPTASERATAVREIVQLSYNGNAASVDQLQHIAANAPDPGFRRAALSALAGMPAVDSFETFVTHGLRDPDATVRIEAARSLIRTKNVNARTLIERAARRETSQDTRDTLMRLAKGEAVSRAAGLNRTHLSN